MANLSIIAAIGANREMGRNNDLLWHISADLKRFKQITSGHTVIMGRKTFESIHSRPLPKRKNIVITNQPEFQGNGAVVVGSLEMALAELVGDEEAFILGGATIYEQFLSQTSKMYLTHVDANYEADVFFPEFESNNWEAIEKIRITDDDQAGVNYSFVTYRRIS